MARRILVFALAAACAGGAWALLSDPGRAAGLSRLWYLGGPLLELRSPEPASPAWRPLGGLEVVVRFPREERVSPDTFRCLLNGSDVTDQLTVGANGAAGHVYPLREGENELACQVFGRGLWDARYFRDDTRARVRARSPLGFDTG